jgi:hypothetical protein
MKLPIPNRTFPKDQKFLSLSFEGDNEKTTIHFVAERFNSAVFTKAN